MIDLTPAECASVIAAWGRVLDGVDISPKPRREPMERLALLRFHANKRRAAKIQRTPAWADLDAMRDMYDRAHALTEETGAEYHVDHIYPLQGKLVSGLHVHNNLQILTASENSKKRNHFEVEE